MRFVSLQKLLKITSGHSNLIEDAFASFSCEKDPDIENFAKERAIPFESLAKSRTYLFIDDLALTHGTIEIAAFFSIALQVLELPNSLSIRQLQALDGFSGKMRGEKISSLPVMLIGQLAKNDKFSKVISGDTILRRAISLTKKAHEIIGGRIITVDVKTDVEKLILFYKRNHFEELSHDPSTGLTQMIYMMCDKINKRHQ